MRRRITLILAVLVLAMIAGGCKYFKGSTDGDTITEPGAHPRAQVTVTLVDRTGGDKVPGMDVEIDTGVSSRSDLGTTNANGVAGHDRLTAVPEGWGEDTQASYQADVRAPAGLSGNGIFYATYSDEESFAWVSDDHNVSSWNSTVKIDRVSLFGVRWPVLVHLGGDHTRSALATTITHLDCRLWWMQPCSYRTALTGDRWIAEAWLVEVDR